MQGNVTLQKVITAIKLSVIMIWFWPLPYNSSKRKLLCMKLYRFVSMILGISAIASMVYIIVQNLDDRNVTVKSALGLFPCGYTVWNPPCHVIIYRRLQWVTSETEKFCAHIKPHEEYIIQRRYIDKYAKIYGFFIASYYITLLLLFISPIILDQPLPIPADFPFDASQQPLRAITYMHQIIVCLQVSAHLSVTSLMAFFLWLASARFKLLTMDMRVAKNMYDFIKCIKKHHQLLKYVNEIALIVRPFALGTVIISTIAIVLYGLILITGVSLILKIQLFLLFVGLFSQVFMYSWPAEHLMDISDEVGRVAFETTWYDNSKDLRKILPLIILRSQKPVTIALPCGLPSLSLHYYASYLSTIFSYFTTMRVMFEN